MKATKQEASEMAKDIVEGIRKKFGLQLGRDMDNMLYKFLMDKIYSMENVQFKDINEFVGQLICQTRSSNYNKLCDEVTDEWIPVDILKKMRYSPKMGRKMTDSDVQYLFDQFGISKHFSLFVKLPSDISKQQEYICSYIINICNNINSIRVVFGYSHITKADDGLMSGDAKKVWKLYYQEIDDEFYNKQPEKEEDEQEDFF